jgi:hypothetical protein
MRKAPRIANGWPNASLPVSSRNDKAPSAKARAAIHAEFLPDMDSNHEVVASDVFCRFMSDLLCRRLVMFVFF